MTTRRTAAIVLRRTNYGEADRILKLLTPDGQMSVMARGVRREKSKLAGGIELFAVSDITVTSGKGDLAILTSARLTVFYRHILEDYDRMRFGYEATKFISRASDTLDDSQWFTIINSVYEGLNQANLSLQLTEAWFYLQYARMVGHQLSLDRDVNGDKLDPNQRYEYDVSEQGLRRHATGVITADHIKYLRLIAAKPLLTVAQIGGVEDILADCYMLARQHAAID